ncbi:Lrp/AsnC family transcriptional regulator [Pandoraea sp.]|uniref:Lrp/AsnC family transcriptional regulator n=1 Tax=Pandoraea sp. TaxID=1883445 RepID=UPI00120E14BC|nr:Lrp/AsnC family transcriptional regulator [Pandoraea sp.]MDE2288420.1 Lrp/AsnC family transcriptional regulator [Burkholderiales bacterium]MDE2608239.1 Lrp/AsnC family transcriptional regulator [Burkholderiales bacterium]TAL57222.1 MAG: Lrp/AsnC family transcriptional regulator [Pandoraea sp.]TAM16530.1 MAG: Lrp/AsnC family transcriptional regulator [Pandoraea sp.]
MDKKDIQILALLQADASIGLNELAKAVNLSPTPCWRRVQKLRDEGVIRQQVVLCDAAKLNLGLTAFVSIRASQHNDAWTQRFLKGVRAIPEIVEIYRMTGETDYLLKVVVSDIAGYDDVYKRLIKVAELLDVSAGFAMEVVKHTTALPLGHVGRD